MRPVFPAPSQHQGPILHLADPHLRAAVQRSSVLRVRDLEEHDLHLHRQLVQLRPKPLLRFSEQHIAATVKNRTRTVGKLWRSNWDRLLWGEVLVPVEVWPEVELHHVAQEDRHRASCHGLQSRPHLRVGELF